MNNFYENLLSEIQKVMQDSDYELALKMIEDELKLPYVPQSVEEQLLLFQKECISQHKSLHHNTKYHVDDIASLLKSDVAKQFMAVELLRKSNIRNHMEEIEEYFNQNPDWMVRAFILECLIDQQVYEELHFQLDGMEITCIPSYLEKPVDQDAFAYFVNTFDSYFGNDNPNFVHLCMQSVVKEMYLRLPFMISEEEYDSVVFEVLKYVYHAMQEEEQFIAFISKKSLANTSGYTLLLYEYDILEKYL